MRRKEKEIQDPKLIESIMQRAMICRVGMCYDNIPYVVPVNFGFKNDQLFFHSASEGKKIDIIKQNNNVCFEIDLDAELEMNQGNPCSGTMKYYSVIGFGKAFIVEDPISKREALDIIVSHYNTGNSFEYAEASINKIVIVRIDIDSVSGKKSGY